MCFIILQYTVCNLNCDIEKNMKISKYFIFLLKSVLIVILLLKLYAETDFIAALSEKEWKTAEVIPFISA